MRRLLTALYLALQLSIFLLPFSFAFRVALCCRKAAEMLVVYWVWFVPVKSHRGRAMPITLSFEIGPK